MILFLSAFLDKKTWGGKRVRSFGFKTNGDKIGEAYLVSAIPNKESIVEEVNMPLSKFYQLRKKDIFGNAPFKEFPLILKLLDCNENLSVQVHPIKVHPKNEAWYFLQIPEDKKIILGHKGKVPPTGINKNNLGKKLNFLTVHKKDVVFVPTGTVHALTKGSMVLEIQQSSDVTYRLYDYDRNIASRPLHLKESAQNIISPYKRYKNFIGKNELFGGLLSTKFFNMAVLPYNWQCKARMKKGTRFFCDGAYWLQCFVMNGQGYVDNILVKKGCTFIVPYKESFSVKGDLEIFVTYIKKN